MTPVRPYLVSLLVGAAVATASTGCPSVPTVPPAPVAVTIPFGPTRTAAAVFDDLEAFGCGTDGGLAAIEQAHARFDRVPLWDCLFLDDGSVAGCGGCP